VKTFFNKTPLSIFTLMKKLTHHAVFIISVLVAYLINGLVMKVLGGIERLHNNKYLSVLIYMTAIVIVFYPIYNLLTKVGEEVGHSVIKQSQKMIGSPVIGLLLGFLSLLGIMFCCYAWVMYKLTVVDMVKALF
jgi:hypothetical protein